MLGRSAISFTLYSLKTGVDGVVIITFKYMKKDYMETIKQQK